MGGKLFLWAVHCSYRWNPTGLGEPKTALPRHHTGICRGQEPWLRLSLACVSPGTGSPLRSSSALGHIQDGVADSGSQLDQTCQTKYSALLWGISLVPPFFSSCLHSLQGLPTNKFIPAALLQSYVPFHGGVCVENETLNAVSLLPPGVHDSSHDW